MVFSEIVSYIADRFNLKSDEQKARIGTEVNLRHREILSSLGVSQVTEQTTATATTTISSRYLTFGPSPIGVVKLLAVYNTALGTYPPPILDEVSPDTLLSMGVGADPPTHYAVTNMGERSVTIKLNSIPATNYVLTADVEGNATQLSGAASPAFSEDYHDILVNMVMADELEKAEKYDKAKEKLKQAETRLGAFRLFIAKSAYKPLVQGSRSSGSGAGMSGGGGAVSGWPAITPPNLPLVVGDLLVATATTAVGRLADVAVGQVLASGGVGVAPAWTASPTLSSLALTTPLPATSGGTGRSVYAVGDILYASTTTAISRLADVATGQVLVSGGVGVAPAYTASPTLTTVLVGDGSVGAAAFAFASNPDCGLKMSATGNMPALVADDVIVAAWRNDTSGAFVMKSDYPIGWSSATPGTNGTDVTLFRDGAADTLALRRGTNAQSLNIYNTISGADKEYLGIGWSANAIYLHTVSSGAGVNRDLAIGTNGAGDLYLRRAGQNTWKVAATGGHFTGTIAGAGLGYSTGAGGAVTQGTSRTTGVTLNTVTGDITLFSAAGSATPATFTVTNSAVAVTDNIIINQKSGTDLYQILITNVAAGSFKITFFTTGGTTTEQPVFHFSIIKGVSS